MTCGCAGKSYNVANPVMGPPPPRIARAQTGDADLQPVVTAQADGIQQVSHELAQPLLPTDVVATVNGRSLLASDVLEQYGAKMREYEAKLSIAVSQGQLKEAEKGNYIRKAQEALLKRELPRMTEQILMSQQVRSKLKKDQMDSVTKQIDTYFEKDVIHNLKTKFEVETTAELEGLLQEQGTSLETMRRIFTDQQLASQYVRTKMGEDPKPTRAELVELYNSQIEKYHRPMQVKWQLLQISIDGKRSLEQSQAQMEKALAELQHGQSFDDIVKASSDGAMKENGGHWDWTQSESVASAEVRAALEKLKPGQISKIIRTPTSLQVVKVTERRESGYQPLDEVQEDLREQIIGEWRDKRVEAILAEAHENAVITTLFDDQPESEDALPVE